MEEMKSRIFELAKAICRIYPENDADVDASETVNQLRNEGFEGVSIELVRGIHHQLSMEAEKLVKSYENSEKAHFYTTSYTYNREFKRQEVYVWSERYVLIYNRYSNDPDSYDIEIFDCFNNKSKQIKCSKLRELDRIYPLADDCAIIVEYEFVGDNEATFFISLVQLDWHEMTFRKLDTIERRWLPPKIIVNKADPTEFCLQVGIEADLIAVRFCKVDRTKLIIGDALEINFDFYFQSYHNGRLYILLWLENHDGLRGMTEMDIYNPEQQTIETIQFNSLEDYEVHPDHVITCEWVHDRIFASFEFTNGRNIIFYSDLQTRRWTMLDFSVNLRIEKMVLFNENDLVIYTAERMPPVNGMYQTNLQFHKITMRKPDYLRNMAWLALVKMMKKFETVADPYEATRRYLPYSSDIRCLFVQPDPNEKRGPPVKRLKQK